MNIGGSMDANQENAFFFYLGHFLLNSGDRRISSAINCNFYNEVITHKNSTLVRLSKISLGKLEMLFP